MGKQNSRGKQITSRHTRENVKRIVKRAARIVLVAAVASSLFYAVLLFNDVVASARVFQLDEIVFHGIRQSDRSQLEEAIRELPMGNLLAVHLDDVRSVVESETWVRSATVRRRLPNQLEIYVEERVPEAVAAIDGELWLVDGEGVLLAPFGSGSSSMDVPIVRGLNRSTSEGGRVSNADKMMVYRRVLGELKVGDQDYTGSLSEVDVSDTEKVRVLPAREPVPVLLGSSDYLRRYESFISRLDLVKEVKDKHGSIEWIDMTFANRIIIHTPRGERAGSVQAGSDS